MHPNNCFQHPLDVILLNTQSQKRERCWHFSFFLSGTELKTLLIFFGLVRTVIEGYESLEPNICNNSKLHLE